MPITNQQIQDSLKVANVLKDMVMTGVAAKNNKESFIEKFVSKEEMQKMRDLMEQAQNNAQGGGNPRDIIEPMLEAMDVMQTAMMRIQDPENIKDLLPNSIQDPELPEALRRLKLDKVADIVDQLNGNTPPNFDEPDFDFSKFDRRRPVAELPRI
ncbi:MAG: hypothetical protein Alpg2KO_26500 [Alphaproteobacteria bacterium]